jgi:TonB family protein
MVHGISGYFHERARFERRLSLTTTGLSIALLGLLALARTPEGHRQLERALARFGYEGANQYVRRITLEQVSGSAPILRERGRIEPIHVHKGGDPDARRTRNPNAIPESRPPIRGPGLSNEELVARAISRIANVPVVRSEELVIDVLVRPTYPPALAEKNVEGRVTVQALIDTIGKVAEVTILSPSGEAQFDRAAEEAVWQCRFRPYKLAGITSEVYAVFRFSFRVY